MDEHGGNQAGGLRPVVYLVLGYCLESAEQAGDLWVWANLKDMESSLKAYVQRHNIPFDVSTGHVKAALLMMEGVYATIERKPEEQGRNLEHSFRIRINPSGKALFEQMAKDVGFPIKNITGIK